MSLTKVEVLATHEGISIIRVIDGPCTGRIIRKRGVDGVRGDTVEVRVCR